MVLGVLYVLFMWLVAYEGYLVMKRQVLYRHEWLTAPESVPTELSAIEQEEGMFSFVWEMYPPEPISSADPIPVHQAANTVGIPEAIPVRDEAEPAPAPIGDKCALLQRGIELVKKEGMSIRAAAKMVGVAESTLRSRLKKDIR